MIWFSADPHYGHKNILDYCKRPFGSVEEMNEVLIERWNKKVGHEDIAYIIGDFALHKEPMLFYERLNGNVLIIPGSHDKDLEREIGEWNVKQKIETVKVQLDEDVYQYITMCHYPMRSWDRSHYGTWHLFGHHHGNVEPYGLSFDVGVDTNDFYPYSLLDVKEKMATLKPIVDYSKKEK